MKDPEKTQQEETALFRYGLIADLVRLAPGTRGLYEKLEKKADQDYRIPGTLRTRVAAETLRDWLKAYRKGGFDALLPKQRSDAGQSRSLLPEVADLLLSIKDDNRELSVQLAIRQALATGKIPPDLPLPPSTVHRLFSRHGLMEKKPGEPAANDHRRFSFVKAGELWMSDVMHGPAVTVQGKVKRKTYLIALLDDATRVLPYAAFALSENTQAYLPVLQQGIVRRGLCKRLFVDNGSAFRSHHLALVCAKLGITLIHARPYRPQSKGKMERWFRTVRMQLLPLLGVQDLSSLEALNRRLWAYVEGEYHHAPHRGLDGETPLERWARCADEVTYPDPQVDLDDLFLAEEKRKVQKDRTVSLRGVVYEVDATLVGCTVTLRYHPSQPNRTVQVWHAGHKIQDAKVVDLYANCFVKRDRPSSLLSTSEPPKPPPTGLRLRELSRKTHRKDEEER
jgi:transposase InsO family protein